MARETRDTGRESGRRSSGSGKKTKKRAGLSHTATEQYGLVDNFDFTILDAYYAPWIMKSKAGDVYDPVLALWVEYEVSDQDKPHTEPISMGRSSLKYYAPSETGFEDEYAGDLSREDWLEIGNGNVGNYDMDELRGGHLLPISSRKSLPANSNGDFFMRTLITSAEANGVELEWEDEEGTRDIGDVLRGLQGHASRLKNDLQKDMDFGDGEPKKDRKVLVIVEVSGYEKAGKGGSSKKTTAKRDDEEEDDRESRRKEKETARDTARTRSKSRGRDDEDEEPDEDTRRASRKHARDEDEEPEEDRKPAARRTTKKASGPDFAAIVKDRDFVDAYLDEVMERIEKSKGKKIGRAALVEISDFDDQEWNETAFELATSDDEWAIGFWERRREVEYDDESGVVRLAK
jgi:hypothetical protein